MFQICSLVTEIKKIVENLFLIWYIYFIERLTNMQKSSSAKQFWYLILRHYTKLCLNRFTKLRALSTLRGLRGAPEVPPLCRETQSLGQQMLNATVGINGLMHTWHNIEEVPWIVSKKRLHPEGNGMYCSMTDMGDVDSYWVTFRLFHMT